MSLKFWLFPLFFTFRCVEVTTTLPGNIVGGFGYRAHGVTYSNKTEYSLYCESEPLCVCNREKDGYIFHCENEVHVRLSFINYRNGFVYITCNKTIQPQRLIHDYFFLLGLQRFEKKQLYLTNCPEPPNSYASLLEPSFNSHAGDAAGMPIFYQLRIYCGDRKDFSLAKEHFEGLSELSRLEISCGALKDLPGDLLQWEWPNLLAINISNTFLERIPEGLFFNLFNLKDLTLKSNRLLEIRNEDFLGLRVLRALRVQENRLMSFGEDVFDRVTTLQSLTLYDSKITRFPKSFGNLVNLNRIELIGNSIEFIELGDCEGFSNLKEIKVVGNLIKRIAPECFGYFNKVESIDISGNSLSDLPGKPVLMSGLRKFKLNDNSRAILHVARFITSDSLYDIQMTNSLIESFDPQFLHSLPNLKTVNLSRNKLSYLHEDFFAFNPILEHISIGENRFSTIPNNLLLYNPLLKVLDISSNNINNLPSSLFANSSSLESLTLAGNEIEVLPKSFLSNLRKLRHLILSDNKIKIIENDSFSDVVGLVDLYLDNNMLDNLSVNIFSSFHEHRHLSTLDLEGNVISSLPLLNIPTLKFLNLANNSLNRLDEECFIHLMGIKSLNLSRNILETLPNSPLVTAKQELLTLDLSFNQLHEIPENFLFEAESLDFLDLSSNKIKRFDLRVILFAEKLREIDLSSNGLNFIGFEIFTYDSLSSVKILKLSNNEINFNYSSWAFDGDRLTWGRISPLVSFIYVEEIHLFNNSISDIFMDWRNMLVKLRELDLRHNKLKFLTHQDLLYSSTIVYQNKKTVPYECSHSLKVDLRHNLIRGVELPSSMLEKLPPRNDTKRVYSHATILIDDNPFHCGCGTLNFLRILEEDVVLTSELKRTEGKHWILSARIDAGNLSCWEPETIRGKKLSETETWMHYLLPTLGLCSLLGNL